MNTDPLKSAQPCGCDPGCNDHICAECLLEEQIKEAALQEKLRNLSYQQAMSRGDGMENHGRELSWPWAGEKSIAQTEELIRQADAALAQKLQEREEKAILGGQVDGKEVRVVDAKTGGEKGSKLARFSLIPFDFLWALAEHYGRGARKYADRNWERGYNWSLTLDAMQRHLALWIAGEDDDPETGSSHLIAVAWHVVALWWFHRHRKGTDDIRRTVSKTVEASKPCCGDYLHCNNAYCVQLSEYNSQKRFDALVAENRTTRSL